jgi:hypothetical protein
VRLNTRNVINGTHPYKLTVKETRHNHDHAQKDLSTFPLSQRFGIEAREFVKSNPGVKGAQLARMVRDRLGIAAIPRDISRLREQLPSPQSFSNDLSQAVSFMEAKGLKHDCLLREVGTNLHEVTILLFGTTEAMEAFRRFPEVLLIDSTYGTNECDYPIVNFVGVDNHMSNFLAASALIFSESQVNFEWLFTAFASITQVDTRAIKVVLSDADQALRNASESDFKFSERLLCRWHTVKIGYKDGQDFGRSLFL